MPVVRVRFRKEQHLRTVPKGRESAVKKKLKAASTGVGGHVNGRLRIDAITMLRGGWFAGWDLQVLLICAQCQCYLEDGVPVGCEWPFAFRNGVA